MITAMGLTYLILGVHLVSFGYHVNELETDHDTINVDYFDSWLSLSFNKLDW